MCKHRIHQLKCSSVSIAYPSIVLPKESALAFQRDCKSVVAWLRTAQSNITANSTNLFTSSSLFQGFQGTVLFWWGRYRLLFLSQHIKPLQPPQWPAKHGHEAKAPPEPPVPWEHPGLCPCPGHQLPLRPVASSSKASQTSAMPSGAQTRPCLIMVACQESQGGFAMDGREG